MRIRTVLAALAVAPALALVPAVPASAGVVFECEGVTPVTTSCTSTGNIGSDGTFQLFVLGVMTNGTVTGTVVTSTMTFTVKDTYQDGQRVDQDVSQSGFPAPNQSYTLNASATGTGYWAVHVF